MGRRLLVLLVAVATLAIVFAPPSSAALRYKIIDFPGAVVTLGLFINDAGAMTGVYVSPSDPTFQHGFVRTPTGKFKTIDVPGATPGTQPMGINKGGTITGFYILSGNQHGFVRSTTGTITTFDCPGNNGTTDDTTAFAINKSGVISGYCTEAGVAKGFVRSAAGVVTSFLAPGATATDGFGINDSGTMVGSFTTAGLKHGYLRTALGAFATIDADVVNGKDTIATAINNAGAVGGQYTVTTGGEGRGFFRDPTGAITTFSSCLLVTSANREVQPTALNKNNVLVGACEDRSVNRFRGLKWREGVLRTIEPAGAVESVAVGINASNVISGYFTYSAGDKHGYIATP